MAHQRKRVEDVVDPLVDAISQLVLAAATNSLDQVKQACEDIAKYTTEVVEVAKDDAIASNDIDVQLDATKAINDIASTIENLVVTFNKMYAVPNKDTQRAFAKAAKDTGDAINALLICADNTYLRKITEAVDNADRASNTLMSQASGSKESLVKNAQSTADTTVKVVKLAYKAGDATIDRNKGQLLKQAADNVKQLGPALIQSSKAVNANPNDPNARAHMQQTYGELRRAYDQLLEYARLIANYTGKVSEAWENAQRLLELARQMEEAALALKRAALQGSKDDFLAAAKRALQLALDLIKAAEAAAALEKDPVKKKMLLDAIEDLKNATKAMMAAAQAAHEDPNNPEKRRALDNAHDDLRNAIAKVIALTDPNQSPLSQFYHTADWVEKKAGGVYNDARKGERPKLVDDARDLAEAAKHFVKVTNELADTMLEPQKRNELRQIAAEVDRLADRLNQQADVVVADPANQQELKELEKRYYDLLNKLDDARRAAGLVVSRPPFSIVEPPKEVPKPAPQAQQNIDMLKGENELVTAAKQQAVEALKIAEEAEKFAHTLTDQQKKQEILDAAGALRKCAHELIAAAEEVAKNPNDMALQTKMLDKQKELAGHIAKVIGLTSAMQEELARAMRELEALLAESEALFNEFFAACKACQADVQANYVDRQGKKAPQEMVSHAKGLSDHAQKIAKLLKEMSTKTNDPRFKGQLDSAAKFIRDKSIQVKMISAVKVAMTGDDVDDNQVVSAAKGLNTEVTDIVKVVRAGLLKRRLASTQAQTAAIAKIRSLWNANRQKAFGGQ